MFPAAWLNSKPSSWQLEKWQNFCEAALSVSYNRRFLWNDFVKLTTLLGFFLFWTDTFCGCFQMQTTLLFLGNLQITPNQWIYSPSVLSKSIATWTYLILYSYQIKLQYIQMHLFQLCTLRDVHFLPLKTLPLPGKPWTSPTLFSLPSLESPLTCQMTVDRGKAVGTHRAMWRGVRFRRFLWANGGRQGDDLVVVAQ